MSFNLGALVPLSMTVTDAAGNPANAGSVSLVIGLPDGTSSTVGPVTPASTGMYDHDFATTQAGRHTVRWVATGANAGAFADVFEVEPADPGQIVSLAEAKAHCNLPDTADDVELLGFVRASTKIVERYVGAVVRRTHVQTFDGGGHALNLTHFPVLSVTSVTETGQAVTSQGYSLHNASGVLRRGTGDAPQLWLPGMNTVVVTYVAGRTAVNPDWSRAALIIIGHMWETQRNSAGGRPPLGEAELVISDRSASAYRTAVPYRALELLGDPVSGLA